MNAGPGTNSTDTCPALSVTPLPSDAPPLMANETVAPTTGADVTTVWSVAITLDVCPLKTESGDGDKVMTVACGAATVVVRESVSSVVPPFRFASLPTGVNLAVIVLDPVLRNVTLICATPLASVWTVCAGGVPPKLNVTLLDPSAVSCGICFSVALTVVGTPVTTPVTGPSVSCVRWRTVNAVVGEIAGPPFTSPNKISLPLKTALTE